MMYFLEPWLSPSEPLGVFVIGTEWSIPKHLDGLPHHRDRFVVDGQYRGPKNAGVYLREHGEYAKSFRTPRQMEGGSAEYRELARRFAHLGLDEHTFRAGPDLRAYVDAHAEDWSGENAEAIGFPVPKRSSEGRLVTAPQGLAGRIRRRSG